MHYFQNPLRFVSANNRALRYSIFYTESFTNHISCAPASFPLESSLQWSERWGNYRSPHFDLRPHHPLPAAVAVVARLRLRPPGPGPSGCSRDGSVSAPEERRWAGQLEAGLGPGEPQGEEKMESPPKNNNKKIAHYQNLQVREWPTTQNLILYMYHKIS